MSFDVFAQSFDNGQPSPSNATEALRVLERYQYSDETNCLVFTFEEGVTLEFFTRLTHPTKPFDGGMFAIRGTTPEMFRFIYEFIEAAELVLIPAMKDPIVALAEDGLSAHLPQDIKDDFHIIKVSSGPELETLLMTGYGAWKAYREYAVGDTPTAPPPEEEPH